MHFSAGAQEVHLQLPQPPRGLCRECVKVPAGETSEAPAGLLFSAFGAKSLRLCTAVGDCRPVAMPSISLGSRVTSQEADLYQ